ncbi:MAG: amino acid-binding protein [Lachnospiraceae bacterium]|nr:amino acid-binding protein [Lachnospiraceae bacterium]
MFVKQISVFMENREGRLEQVTEVLKQHAINILSLSMADTTEYGMLRMVVSDPDAAQKALQEKGFSARLTDVLAVRLEDKAGELHKLTHILCANGINIEYMYALASAEIRAMIVKASDGEAAGNAILDGGLELYGNEEMCKSEC